MTNDPPAGNIFQSPAASTLPRAIGNKLHCTSRPHNQGQSFNRSRRICSHARPSDTMGVPWAKVQAGSGSVVRRQRASVRRSRTWPPSARTSRWGSASTQPQPHSGLNRGFLVNGAGAAQHELPTLHGDSATQNSTRDLEGGPHDLHPSFAGDHLEEQPLIGDDIHGQISPCPPDVRSTGGPTDHALPSIVPVRKVRTEQERVAFEPGAFGQPAGIASLFQVVARACLAKEWAAPGMGAVSGWELDNGAVPVGMAAVPWFRRWIRAQQRSCSEPRRQSTGSPAHQLRGRAPGRRRTEATRR